jgi:hypothetical protein
MPNPTITLQIPENLYQRLANTANAVGHSLDEIMLQALTLAVPPIGRMSQKNFRQNLPD